MTNPVEQALEEGYRAAHAAFGEEVEYTAPPPELVLVLNSFAAAFLRSIASAPTPEMTDAGWRTAAAHDGCWDEIADATWRAMASKLADQVEERRP